MSKAEDRALEKYPKKIEWIGNQWDGAPFDVNSEKRFGYQQGYHQAEKDLEITIDDIMKLDALLIEMWNTPSNEDKYQEVLKRFIKERKKNDIRRHQISTDYCHHKRWQAHYGGIRREAFDLAYRCLLQVRKTQRRIV